MLDRPLTVWVNLAVVEYNYPKSNKFDTGVKIKATACESKPNESPNDYCFCMQRKSSAVHYPRVSRVSSQASGFGLSLAHQVSEVLWYLDF